MDEENGYDVQMDCLEEIRKEVCSAIYNVNVGALKEAHSSFVNDIVISNPLSDELFFLQDIVSKKLNKSAEDIMKLAEDLSDLNQYLILIENHLFKITELGKLRRKEQ